jgi:hypothetical protein
MLPNREEFLRCKTKAEADELLSRYDWYPELEYTWIDYDPILNRALKIRYYIDGDIYPCRSGTRYSYYKLQSTGCCILDSKLWQVSGIISVDQQRVLDKQIISLDDALEYCDLHNIRYPIGLYNYQKEKKAVLLW